MRLTTCTTCLFSLLLTACAAGTAYTIMQYGDPELTEPQENGMLLLGAVIVEAVPAHRYPPHLRVLLKGEIIDESGSLKRIQIEADVDEDGYFAIENVLPGRWALQGVWIGYSLIWNDLETPGMPWVSARRLAYPIPLPRARLTGDHWPTVPKENVYDFGYNVFILADYIQHYRMDRLDNASFTSPKTWQRPPLLEHFIERYPESGWTPLLTRLAGG